MELALLGALLIGVILGLLGSGGSILTVPILIFILQRPEKLAIAESLAIVGLIALLGAIPYIMRAQIHWRSVFFFGLPGMLGSCVGGSCSYYVSSSSQVILFAIVMLVVAMIMLSGPSFETFTPSKQAIWITIGEGFLLGCLTSFIGIGGGFLIVPALLILSHLSISFAIGTSLIIIAMNSLTGFIQQFFALKALQMDVDWKIIMLISIVGIIGSFAGSMINKKISQTYLRKIFGLSVLMMGFYILFNQF